MKKVMVFGTFDGVHQGHLNFFQQAKKMGDFLVVVVARDVNVQKIKKHLPRFSEKERVRAVRGVKIVDEVFFGELEDYYKIIEKIKPQVICLGYDQKITKDRLSRELKKRFLKVLICRLRPYQPEKYKSSKINN